MINSGLLFDLFDIYLVLAESLADKQYECLNNSSDLLLKSLEKEDMLKQEIAQYLFNAFEKRSLFTASEHLALAMLNDNQCQLDTKHKALFEQYRKMKIGNPAPNIPLTGINMEKRLSDIQTPYKLILFGASWCPNCQQEIPKLKEFYFDWKTKYNLEAIYISLDEDKESHNKFTADFPWKVSCDFKGWDSETSQDFSVFSTPTMYLLDNNNVILLKPISLAQVNSWLEVNALH